MLKTVIQNRTLLVIGKLYVLQLALQSLLRLIFLLAFKTSYSEGSSGAEIAGALFRGINFDSVSAAYLLLLPALLFLLSAVFPRHKTNIENLIRWMSIIFFWAYALVAMIDFPYYAQFGTHLNKQAFLWADSPAFVLRMIFGTAAYYGYLFAFIVLAFIEYRFISRTFKTKLVEQPKLVTGSLSLLALALLVIAARGRLSGKSTIHEGLAIVGQNKFVNQLALNPNFTFYNSIIFNKDRPYQIPSDIDKDIAFAREYLGCKGANTRSIARSQKADSGFCNYNVVIVCMESMSAYKMGLGGREVLTPQLNAVVKESLYFDQFFSSGMHTFNGLFSTCAGYPSMLTDHMLRRYTAKPFVTLGNLLKAKNYTTSFYATHDPQFDNMAGFFTLNGYDKVYSAFDLPSNKNSSATGVPDHELFDLFIKNTNESKSSKPFLSFIMTGSDHGPWAIPEGIDFVPSANTKQKRGTQYADWAIGRFMKMAKQQSWYKNTLFVFLGDHGYYLDHTYELPLSYHLVPFILHKPNTLAADTLHHLGNQSDVTATIAGVLNLEFINSTFGSDIRYVQHPFVYFTADDKLGCYSNNGYYYYNMFALKTKRLHKLVGGDRPDYYPELRAKGDSMEVQAQQMLNAAEYFLKKDYYNY